MEPVLLQDCPQMKESNEEDEIPCRSEVSNCSNPAQAWPPKPGKVVNEVAVSDLQT
jgi:hypothetical protein